MNVFFRSMKAKRREKKEQREKQEENLLRNQTNYSTTHDSYFEKCSDK